MSDLVFSDSEPGTPESEKPLNPPLFRVIDLNNRYTSKFGDKEQLFFPRDARKGEWMTDGAIFYQETDRNVSATKASQDQIDQAKLILGQRVLDTDAVYTPVTLTALDEIPPTVLAYYQKLGGSQSAHHNLNLRNRSNSAPF